MQHRTDEEVEGAKHGNGGKEKACRIGRRSDESPYPQHDRCHVAYGREAAAHAGRHYDGAGVDDALVVIAHYVGNEAHHEHHRGKIVHIGRDDEGEDGYSP